jgi:hypothetical protein
MMLDYTYGRRRKLAPNAALLPLAAAAMFSDNIGYDARIASF